MTAFVIITAMLCAWAMLRVLGGECERQLQAAELRAALKPAASAVYVAHGTPFKMPPPGSANPTKSPAPAPAAAAAPAPAAAKPAR